MLGRERVEGEHVGLGIFEQRGDLRQPPLELLDGVTQPPAGLSPSSAVKIERMIAPSASCWSRRTWPRRSRRKCTVQRCHGAPRTWASAAFRPGARRIASSTPTSPRATSDREELAPERLGLRLADVQADDLAAAGLVDGVRDDDALARDTAAVADLLDLRVDEQIRIPALQRPLTERLHLLIEQPGDPTDLALGDPQPEALDELIDAARRHAADIRLLHHADTSACSLRLRGCRNDGK